MNGVKLEIDWEILGAELAHLSLNKQNAFFRGFSRMLRGFDANIEKERQMPYVKAGTCIGERSLTIKESEVYSYLCEVSGND